MDIYKDLPSYSEFVEDCLQEKAKTRIALKKLKILIHKMETNEIKEMS